MACTGGSTSFQLAAQWTQDPNHHILHICLPGFDEFKVQVDDRGKLTIRGRRPLGDGKYMRLEQVFDVPKDSHIDKIEGKFDDARLSLLMPKKVVTEKETQRAVSCEEKPKQEPPRAVCGWCKKEQAKTQEDPPKSSDLKRDESLHKEKPKCGEARKEPAAVHEEKPSTYKKKEEHVPYPAPPEPIPEQKPRSRPVSDDKLEEYKKNGMAWKVKVDEEREGWLDYGLIDGLLEKISKNKKATAAVAAAFTVGFYLSRKL